MKKACYLSALVQTFPDDEVDNGPSKNKTSEEFPLHSTQVFYSISDAEDFVAERFGNAKKRSKNVAVTHSKNSSTDVVLVTSVLALEGACVVKHRFVFHELSAEAK